MLKLLRARGSLNVNEISRLLELPQSTIATNVQVLEEAQLIATETVKAKKGHQKICTARFDEIIVRFEGEEQRRDDNIVEVSMPLGLYTSCEVSASVGCARAKG